MGTRSAKTSDDGGVRTDDRRRYPRAEVALDIILANENASRWRGQTVDLNQFGLKVRFETGEPGPLEGTILRLQLAPPDGKPPMVLSGIVWHVHAQGQGSVVVFSNLATNDFLRLKQLTDSLLAGHS